MLEIFNQSWKTALHRLGLRVIAVYDGRSTEVI